MTKPLITITRSDGTSIDGDERLNTVIRLVTSVWESALNDGKSDAKQLEVLAIACTAMTVETLQACGHADGDIPELCRKYAQRWRETGARITELDE